MKRENERIAAVIVTHNRVSKLKISLQNTLDLPFSHIVVVDNASTDATRDYLDTISDERLIVIRSTTNQGGAGGFAQGIRTVTTTTDATWLVCYDDDAFPSPASLAEFAQLPKDERIGGFAAAVYYPDGSICPMNRPGLDVCRSFASFATAAKRKGSFFGLADHAYRQELLVDVAFSSFVGFFVRCDLIRSILGLPRADLFIYREDSLYTLSLVRHGYRLIFAPKLRFIHDCETLKTDHVTRQASWRDYYIIRNDLIFFREYFGAAFFLLLPLIFIRMLRAYVPQGGLSRYARIAAVAIRDGLRHDLSKKHEDVMGLMA